MENNDQSLEGKVRPTDNSPRSTNPRLRVLYLRGPGSDDPQNFDPTKMLRNYATVSVPTNGLDALLELNYVVPHLVLADTDYCVSFPSGTADNSLVQALVDVLKRKDQQYTGLDFLQLARRNQIPSILSHHEAVIPPLPTAPKRKKKGPETPEPVVAFQQTDLLINTLRTMGIEYALRAKNGKTRKLFERALHANFDRIREQLAHESCAEADVQETPFNFYVILGSTSAGKSRTISALLDEASTGKFWQIPKATSREPRSTDKVGSDTFFVKPSFFDELKGEFIEYGLYGHRYGLPKKLIDARLHQTNILFGTASAEAVKELTIEFDGKIVPILLYPPRDFVKARVRATADKADRVGEVERQYDTFDKLLDNDQAKYVIRFNPENINTALSQSSPTVLASASVFDDRTQSAIDSIVMSRVRNIIAVEEEIRRRATAKKLNVEPHQAFYNLWVDSFVETLLPRMAGGFGELETRVKSGETIKLFEIDKEEDVARYTRWMDDGGLAIPKGNLGTMLPRDIVAVGRSYGIAHIFLNPPTTLKYSFGTEADLVRLLLMRALKPLFPYTIRDNNSGFQKSSNFAYVQSEHGSEVSDLFQYRITDNDGDSRDLTPAQWPLRGIAIGFARSTDLVPVNPSIHYTMRQENYAAMVYRERSPDKGHPLPMLPAQPIIIESEKVKSQEPPAPL